MTVTLLVQNVAYIYAVLLERERSLYLLSVLRNMSYEWEKNFEKFFVLFFAQKHQVWKIFDTIFGSNVAYETFVQFTKPKTLYSVSDLRFRDQR